MFFAPWFWAQGLQPLQIPEPQILSLEPTMVRPKPSPNSSPRALRNLERALHAHLREPAASERRGHSLESLPLGVGVSLWRSRGLGLGAWISRGFRQRLDQRLACHDLFSRCMFLQSSAGVTTCKSDTASMHDWTPEVFLQVSFVHSRDCSSAWGATSAINYQPQSRQHSMRRAGYFLTTREKPHLFGVKAGGHHFTSCSGADHGGWCQFTPEQNEFPLRAKVMFQNIVAYLNRASANVLYQNRSRFRTQCKRCDCRVRRLPPSIG